MRLELEGDWVLDGDGAERQLLRVSQVLVRRQTRHQKLEIVATEAFGRMLLLDGQVQSAERDEFLYHEALVQPAMLLGEQASRVLILGGGEGATLREVFRHASVTHATMVDIDGDVVHACREHLPTFSQGSFADARARLVIADANAFLERAEQTWDVIIQDVTDPTEDGPAAALFQEPFFARVRARLSPGGRFVVQCGSASITQLEGFAGAMHTLRRGFTWVAPYTVNVPSFAAPWSFCLAANEAYALPTPGAWAAALRERLREPPRSLDGATLAALFTLPPHLSAQLGTQP